MDDNAWPDRPCELLDLPEALLLQIAGFLPHTSDLAAFRHINKSMHALLDAGAIACLLQSTCILKANQARRDSGLLPIDLQSLTVSGSSNHRSPEVGKLLRLHADITNPVAGGKNFGGAWTEDSHYFRRQAAPDTLSTETLRLIHVWWLDVCCTIQGVSPGNYVVKARLGTSTSGTVLKTAVQHPSSRDKIQGTLNLRAIDANSHGVSDPAWHFGEFNIGRIALTGDGLQSVDVSLHETEQTIKRDILFDAVRLVRQANEGQHEKTNHLSEAAASSLTAARALGGRITCWFQKQRPFA